MTKRVNTEMGLLTSKDRATRDRHNIVVVFLGKGPDTVVQWAAASPLARGAADGIVGMQGCSNKQ